MFTGRTDETARLESLWRSSRGELAVITGRRRIGKSSLVKHFAHNKRFLQFEGLENESSLEQIHFFTSCLMKQIDDPVLKSVKFTSWVDAFQYLTAHLPDRGDKLVLFFDELQWMAAGHGKLISIIKSFWDNHWKNKKILLILCGSIASFMTDKVIRSKALYGRITSEIKLKALLPHEAKLMFRKKRGTSEILQYLMTFGGVPKYMELIDLNKSFAKNINELCFDSSGIMQSEFEKAFYSQFKSHQTYLRIIRKLKDRILSLNEISQTLKMPSGGGLQRYLEHLEEADFIKSHVPFGQKDNSKFRKYRLFDEFLVFYFHFMEPNLRLIRESSSKQKFEMISKKNWDIWCGFALERFCIKHSAQIAELMGFAENVLSSGPYFGRNDTRFQIDLLYHRNDKVITLCEIKHNQNDIGTDIIAEVERKTRLLKIPRGHTLEKALIVSGKISPAVIKSDYFHHTIEIERILNRT